MGKLTERQKEVLSLIVNAINRQGYPPSIREIADELNISSPRGVINHLEALEKKGYIKRDSSARGIKIIKTEGINLDEEIVHLPVVGDIAAGTPILAEENIETWIPLPLQMTKGRRDAFLLRVKGDSMKDAGILDGDLAIVLPRPLAEEGDKVVALLEDEATIKYFHKKGSKVVLKAANPKYPDREVSKNLIIHGKVIGVIRG